MERIIIIYIMKKTLIVFFSLIFANFLVAQQSVSISGPSTVEVGVPYNYTFQFSPVYPSNGVDVADGYIITEWIVLTGTNGSSSGVAGYIGSPSNQSSYYYNGTYNNSNPFTVPIQWGNGTFLSNDNITVKVSGIYIKSSSGAHIGYFNYLSNTKSVTVQRMNAPVIVGASPISSCNQTNQIYSFSNSTNSDQRLWAVTGSATIIGSNTGTSVTVKPPLTGSFTVNCAVKRSGANANYSVVGSKTVTRTPFVTSAIISGNQTICSSGVYTVSNLPAGQSFSSWSISDPSIATLSSTSSSSTTLTKVGQGTVTLTAIILSSCNETASITKSINVGAPILPPSATVTGAASTNFNQTQYYTLEGDSTNGGSTYQWSVDAPINDDGGPTCAWQVVSGQGTKTVRLLSGCIATTAVVRVVATGACGSSNMKYMYVTVGNEARTLVLSQNPVRNGHLEVQVVELDSDGVANTRVSDTISNVIKIYDLIGNIVYNGKQNTNELLINNLQLKKGIYILEVETQSGERLKKKIVIE
nr:T9SS type A sorting domain-containing protein [uncultured Flavobacterium sp.]